MSNLFLPEATQASPGNAVWSPTLRPDWWVPLACSGGSRRCHNEKVSLSSVLPRRWWLQAFFIFTPLFGEESHFDSYFSIGLKPSTRVGMKNSSPKRDHEIFSSALWTWIPLFSWFGGFSPLRSWGGSRWNYLKHVYEAVWMSPSGSLKFKGYDD